jgi:hypothetical protein
VCVRYNRHFFAPAYRPQLRESIPVQHTDAGGVGLRIKIIVENGFSDFTALTVLDTK